MGYFAKRRNIGTEGLILPSGPTANRPSTPADAAMRYNTDTDSIEYFNGAVYVDIAKAGTGTVVVDHLATDGLTATFTMTQEVPADDEANIVVFISGVYQAPGLGQAYTVSGLSIIFTSIPPSALTITIVHGVYGTYVPNSNVFDVPNL